MLNRIKELLKKGKDFAFETTLSTLIYFWLESVDLAKNRVLERVKKGGF